MKINFKQIYEGVVYKITNLTNDKVYIGSSISGLIKRKRCHLTNLKNNNHHSLKLQNSWNKYGRYNFKFEIIEYCSKLDILKREQYWIDYYNSYEKGYNASPIAGNCEGREVKLETRLKIAKSLKGRKVNRTEEHNRKLAITKYKPVTQYNSNGIVINKFINLNEAVRVLGLSQSVASSYCRGKVNNAKFILKYEG